MATETVTVMFTDLVGSTELLSRLGEEACELIRREYFGLLRSAVDGRDGREIKNLGDGLMVVFDSSADAVGAAVDVQRMVERRNRRAVEPLRVRVGVAAGDADVDGGDYFGIPVVEAARLCAATEGGSILVTDVVRLLAGSRGGFRVRPIDALELRGLDRPVPACQVDWQTDDPDDAPPMPPRLAAAASDVFVGRELEQAQLFSAWKAVAAAGERRLILVEGEPGIGKTTLSAQLAVEVRASGAVVAYGRCDEDLGIPYQPWIQAMGQIAAALPADLLGEVAEGGDGTLGRLLPELAGRLPEASVEGEDAGAARFALFAAVIDLLRRATLDRPILLVMDDLHWADRTTLQLLKHLVTSDADVRIGVLGTYRDSDIGPGHPLTDLLADLHRERGVERVALRGLGDAELLALLELLAGHEMPEDGMAIRDAVLAETAGNPFFVLEILRHLADTGAISQGDDGRWTANRDVRSAGLPVSVREVVSRRIGSLGTETERVLSLAAVIGRDFDIGLLAAIAGRSEEEVIDCCDAAVEAEVLETTVDPERYTFAHALFEHTIYEGLSRARRSRTHRAVALRLEELHGSDPGERAGELAHHWSAGLQPSDESKAVHYGLIAARRALDQLAPDEALRRFQEVLQILDRGVSDDRMRAEVLIGLGVAQRQCGLPDHRQTLLQAAELADRIDAVDLLVRSAAANSREFSSVIGGIDEERVAVIERALERVGDVDPAARARLLVVNAMERTYRAPLDDRLAMIEEAIALARGCGDAYLLAQVLQRSCDAAEVPWTLQRRIAWATEASELAEERGDLEALLNARVDLMIAALEGGDPESMRRCEDDVEDLVRRIPQPALQWVAAMHRAMLTVLAGDLETAEREAEAAYALAVETGQPDPLGVYGPQLTNIRLYQGRAAEMLPLIEEMAASDLALPAHVAALGVARSWGGDLEGARSLLAAARAGGFAIPEDQGWASAHVSWAVTAAAVGDHDSARVLGDRLRPFADHLVTTNVTVQPSVAHHLGLLDHSLGRHDAAEQWFRMASGIHERMGSHLFVAVTSAAWAALRADVGDHDGARRLAASAMEAAEAAGYGGVASDAGAVLERVS